MSRPTPAPKIDLTLRQLDTLLQSVIERGSDEKDIDFDDYSLLMRTIEYRRLVTYQLYDSYFPPKRHEYELQLLTKLVEAATSHTTADFVEGTIAGGVIGNTAYACVKHLLLYLISKLKPIKRSETRFREIAKNSDKLMQFFSHRKQADLPTISRALNVEGGKIEPLLMLLGFTCRRRGKRRIWIVPNHTKKKGSSRKTTVDNRSNRW
jgi:hypothetical protein